MSVMVKVTFGDGSHRRVKFKVSDGELVLDFRKKNIYEKDIHVNLSKVSSIKNLRSFSYVVGGNAETIDLSPLASCKDLQSIKISGALKSLNLEPLRETRNLRKLILQSSRIADLDLSPLSSCQELDSLYIDSDMESINLTPLSSCRKLSRLSIRWLFSTKLDLSPLSSCTSLSYLAIQSHPWGENPRVKEIDLSPLRSCPNLKNLLLGDNELEYVDLTPFHGFKEIKVLNLFQNKLKSIDLTPLDSCTNLQSILLDDNKLKSIDLSPLSSCPNLKELRLDKNQLSSIDLSPLRLCVNLEDIYLAGNELDSIDLSPLHSCPRLSSITLNGNNIQEINLSPLAASTNFHYISFNAHVDCTPIILHPSLARIDGQRRSWIKNPFHHWRNLFEIVEPPSPEGSWELLHRLAAIPKGMSISIQSYILKILRLENFGFIDSDISEFLLSIPPETSIDNARELVREHLVEVICEQIDRGGTTIGLEFQDLQHEVAEIAVRVPKIAELRGSEMQGLEVKLDHTARYSLHQIYLTAYGFSILRQMVLVSKFYAQENELKRIQHAIRELGYDLIVNMSEEGIEPDLYQPTKMSKQMKYYIFGIVERTTLDSVKQRRDNMHALIRGIRVPQLKELLRKHNLPREGTKHELANRVIDEMGWIVAAELIEKYTKRS